MRKTTIICVLALAAMATTAMGGKLGAATDRAVTPTELRKLFPGRFSAVVKGYRVRFVAKGNGRLKGFYGGMSDEGRWSVRGSRLCVMLREWLDGRTTCARVRRENGDWYRARDIRFRKM